MGWYLIKGPKRPKLINRVVIILMLMNQL